MDDKRAYLPLTSFDATIDAESLHVGRYLFEKHVSGMYIGEVARVVLLHLVKQAKLFGGTCPDALKGCHTFPTAFLSAARADDLAAGLPALGDILTQLGVSSGGTASDRYLVWRVCQAVARRAARLSGAAIAALLDMTDSVGKDLTVGMALKWFFIGEGSRQHP